MKNTFGKLIICFVFGLFYNARAQNMDIAVFPYVNVGYSVDRFDPDGINLFHTTFNDFWGNQLSSGWEQVKGNELSHPFFALGFKGVGEKEVGLSWGIGFQYGSGSFRNSTTWTSGVVQQYHFRARHFMWTAEIGMAIKQRFLLDFYISGTGKTLALTYTTVYADGSESIGTEYKLNGFYSGLTSALEFGPQVSYRHWKKVHGFWKNQLAGSQFSSCKRNCNGVRL